MTPALLAQNPDFAVKASFRRKAFITQNSENSSSAESRVATPAARRSRSLHPEIVIPRPLRSLSRVQRGKCQFLNNFENIYEKTVPTVYKIKGNIPVTPDSQLGRFIICRRDRRATAQILTRQNPNEIIRAQRTDIEASSLTGDVGICDEEILAFLSQNREIK